MSNRNIYLTKVGVALTLSLVLTLILMKSALSFDTSEIQEEPYRVESFELDGPGNLQVKTSGGHITVEGSSSNTVRVEMYVRKDGDNLLPENTRLKNWEINISQSENSIEAIAKRNDEDGWSLFEGNDHPSISFVVYTPREMSSNLKTSGGHIEVRGLSGKQNITTSGGHLKLANLKGTIDARTSGGHVNISDVQGELSARTSGGHIDVQKSEGKLKVKTSGGHIDLAEVSGTVEAKTSGGSITADLRSISQAVDLRTSGGNVEISVPKNMGLDLNLEGSYVSSTELSNFSGEVERDVVDGQLNGGGPSLTARTSGGTVSLSFQ